MGIQGCVAVEGGGVVDLEKPGITITIDKDVETKDLEAHIVVDITRLRCPVMMDQVWLDRYERFHDHVSHLGL